MLHLVIEGQNLAFHLPVVSELGGGILFRLFFLNSVWILFLPFRKKDRLIATCLLGALQPGFVLLLNWVCIASFWLI
jgi:hypothetical protein